jgi:predicted nucleic acid-binding protein
MRVTYLLDTNATSDLMRASQRIENWMAKLSQDDRVVTCTIVRGEVLFGIARLPAGRRRAEATTRVSARHAGVRTPRRPRIVVRHATGE